MEKQCTANKSCIIDEVINFNVQILGIDHRPIGLLSQEEADITVKCLREEINEFLIGQSKNDIVECVDALIDSIYFSIGALYKMGLTGAKIRQCIEAVHGSNMQKKKGVNHRRGDGSAADAIKPINFQSPEEKLSRILNIKFPPLEEVL